MMKSKHLDALTSFLSAKISFEEFLDIYPVDPRKDEGHVHDLLIGALEKHDKDEVEAAVLLGHRFEAFTPDCVTLLNTLITANWHSSHEDIAEALQVLRDPRSSDALYEAALMKLDYLGGDESALGRKCCWALGTIGTPDADQKLQELAESDTPTVSEAALYELDRRNREA